MQNSVMNIHTVLTHVPHQERPSLNDIQEKLALIKAKNPQLSEVCDQLSEFELGRFFIANNGALSGWWTYYCILGFKNYAIKNPIEKFILEKAPVVLATRERFTIFQNFAQEIIREKKCITVASIPGGLAADMLTLDVTSSTVKFVSVDLDPHAANLAHKLAKELGNNATLETRCEDAWNLSKDNEFDLIFSNGLNIYVSEREKVVELYKSFLRALKPGGHLITSSLTAPPSVDKNCEWNFAKINAENLAQQVDIFAKILQAKWSNFRSTQEMKNILSEAGFSDIKVVPDSQNIFPTFVGVK